MEYSAEMIRNIVEKVVADSKSGSANNDSIPVGVSNRHIHLSREHVDKLFGEGYNLRAVKELSQVGQYACNETLTIVGPSMRAIEGVRVLGPERKATQVEISRTDSYLLKVKPPVRESGDIKGTPGITIIGPSGVVTIGEGCIIANRHVHMSEDDAKRFGVKDGDYVNVEANGERKTLFYDVQIRVHRDFRLEMHIDTDDANAAGIGNGFNVKIV